MIDFNFTSFLIRKCISQEIVDCQFNGFFRSYSNLFRKWVHWNGTQKSSWSFCTRNFQNAYWIKKLPIVQAILCKDPKRPHFAKSLRNNPRSFCTFFLLRAKTFDFAFVFWSCRGGRYYKRQWYLIWLAVNYLVWI